MLAGNEAEALAVLLASRGAVTIGVEPDGLGGALLGAGAGDEGLLAVKREVAVLSLPAGVLAVAGEAVGLVAEANLALACVRKLLAQILRDLM